MDPSFWQVHLLQPSGQVKLSPAPTLTSTAPQGSRYPLVTHVFAHAFLVHAIVPFSKQVHVLHPSLLRNLSPTMYSVPVISSTQRSQSQGSGLVLILHEQSSSRGQYLSSQTMPFAGSGRQSFVHSPRICLQKSCCSQGSFCTGTWHLQRRFGQRSSSHLHLPASALQFLMQLPPTLSQSFVCGHFLVIRQAHSSLGPSHQLALHFCPAPGLQSKTHLPPFSLHLPVVTQSSATMLGAKPARSSSWRVSKYLLKAAIVTIINLLGFSFSLKIKRNVKDRQQIEKVADGFQSRLS